MERILYFDCFAGISGDMSIGALIDLGLSPETVISEINKLGIDGYQIEIRKMNRYSISGTDVKVTLTSGHSHGHLQCHSHDQLQDHSHNQLQDHSHDHLQGHSHDHDHPHTHEHIHSGHHEHDERERSLSDITRIIQASTISEKAKALSIAIFTEIAKAEAKVHGKTIEEVHFHEVGAIDSIVDIVGAAVCIDMLQVDRVYCSPVHEGQGFVNCRHGRLPIPVPAVIQMLQGSGISIVTEDIQAELVTPTGFGILKTVSESCGKMPEMAIEGVGYGFGKTETGRLNALRVVLGTTKSKADSQQENPHPAGFENPEISWDTVSLLETNIDDSTGETLGYTMKLLMDAGALDVFFTPIYMKKNRPAYMLSLLSKSADVNKLSQCIFRETSSIGIRVREIRRITLNREIKTVKTELGEIRVKSVTVSGLERIQPEYEDCARLARENHLSLNEVYEIVKRR